ncbi:MAG: insulinase family protein [Haliscomenobacter sp.]|nr:insulinase family protein [Haliscomenobacter sp.]
MHFRALLVWWFVFRFGVALFAQTSGQPIPLDPAVRMGRLPNGLTYYIRQHPKPENRVEMRLVVRAGSLQEDEDQLGIAHLVEHLAFNGTSHFQKNELIHFLERSGQRFGPDLNAYTSFEETVYMLQVRTDSSFFLQQGLLILEDWASGLTFDSVEVEKERGVVISEWRNQLSPDQRLQQRYFPVLYEGSRFAERLPIGDPEVIRTIPLSRIRQFYQDWYRPDLMAVVVVGDIDPDSIEAEIKKRFSPLTNPSPSRVHQKYSVPGQSKSRIQILTDPEAAFTQLRYAIKLPGLLLRTSDDWKRQITGQLFNSMLNLRLLELQQKPDPSFTFAYSGIGTDFGGNQAYSITTTGGESQVRTGLEEILGATLQAVQHGFTKDELDRQKAELLRYAERAVKESENTPSNVLASALVSHFLEKGVAPSPSDQLRFYKQAIQEITHEGVQQLAKSWFLEPVGVLTLTSADKNKGVLPDSVSLAQTLQQLFSQDWPPRQEPEGLYGPLIQDTPLFETPVTFQGSDSALQVSEWKLTNGIRVILKPTSFKEDEILVTAFSPGGHSLYPDSLFPAASNAIAILNQSGVGRFTYPQLTKYLTGKSLSVTPFISELEEGFSGTCAPGELEDWLQLLFLYATKPRFDSLSVASYVKRQKELFRDMMINPYYVFGQTKEKIKFQGHFRRGIPDPADLDWITAKDLHEIYSDRFGDAGDFTFVFVGKFSPDTLLPLVSRYLGNLPASGRNESFKDIMAYMPDFPLDTTFYGGQPPKTIAELTFHGSIEGVSSHRYAFNSLMSLLRLRLREVLREEMGGVYGVNVYGNVAAQPLPAYRITITFNCDLHQVNALVQAVKDEIRNLQTIGPSPLELEKIKETQWQSRLKNEKENSFWLSQLAARYREGVSLEGLRLNNYKKTVDQLHPEILRCAAQRFLSPNTLILIRLLPE